MLNCGMNEITDLSPLTGMPLDSLECAANRIHELSPLRGLPLRIFSCSGNTIEELGPFARHAVLHTLLCSQNLIRDLTPLHGLPLHTLRCAQNLISDLAPLRGMPLQRLSCAKNHITDLSSLVRLAAGDAGLPGECHCRVDPRVRIAVYVFLTAERIPLTSLRPLSGMAIEDLAIDGIPLTPENLQVIQALPLTHLECNLTGSAAPAPLGP